MNLCVSAPADLHFAMLLWRWYWFPVQQWAESWWCSAVGHWVLWVYTVAFWDSVYPSDPLYSYSRALSCICTDIHNSIRKHPLLAAETQKWHVFNTQTPKHSYEGCHKQTNFACMDHTALRVHLCICECVLPCAVTVVLSMAAGVCW